MNKKQLFENIKRKKSFLCIGLETELEKIPSHLRQEADPIFAFNKANIAAASEGEEATVETVEAVAVEATDSCCQAKDSCATACDKKADCTEKKECCDKK